MELMINIFSLVGSLALFLFGMKTMSEGLEKFAGDRLRSILAAMTKNRVMGVLTGVLITALIQSSSATTVMVVSFVNAGLMTLGQSIGVIMGANIGTTVTAWIISAVGFKVNIAAFAIPLLAIGMPLIFSGKGNRKSIGEFIFGFSFLFMGLAFLQEAATAMNIGDMVAGMLAHVPQDSFFTIILFVIVGALVTMIVQASAATMAITLMLFGKFPDSALFRGLIHVHETAWECPASLEWVNASLDKQHLWLCLFRYYNTVSSNSRSWIFIGVCHILQVYLLTPYSF